MTSPQGEQLARFPVASAPGSRFPRRSSPERLTVLNRVGPFLVLAVLGLLFFADLVAHPSQVLYSDHSDLLAQYLPAKHFLVHSWRETGEMPLWNPYSYGGMPFVHDPQLAAFYPPHYLLYLLPESLIGAGMSWLIFIHVLVAGWGMYAYSRSQGLGVVGGLVSAIGFMFAGKWMLHLLGAGHYTTIGLAWLPLVLLCLDQAIRRGSVLWGTWAGGLFALVILGTQPQWSFYAGVFIALWTLGTALENAGYFGTAPAQRPRRTVAALASWLGWGAWTAALALALSAVQLLPTLEAAAESSRAAGVATEDTLASGMRALLFFVGPALAKSPPNLMWEDRGGFGLLWVAVAILAPLLRRGRVRFQAGVCLVLILFAVGGSALLQGLPGFRLFRQPTRMLLIATFPVAMLAGTTIQALITDGATEPGLARRCRRMVWRIVVAVAILCGGFALRLTLENKEARWHVYWLTLTLTVPALLWLLRLPSSIRRSVLALVWVGVLIIDLWALTWPLVAIRPETDIYAPSRSVEWIRNKGPIDRVLDRDDGLASSGTPLGAGAPLALLHQIGPVRGYNPLDHRRFKEYLQWIGHTEQPLRPFESPLAFPIIGSFPIKNKPLVDLLGIRYLLQPSDMPLEQPGWRVVCIDPRPVAYDAIAGGRRDLSSYTLYENPDVLPRAFVVGRAVPLPDPPELLTALETTDFRREVLLEDPSTEPGSDSKAREYEVANLRVYQPNRVVVDVDGVAEGWLVLTDPWFPGWSCTVDGEPTEIHRANSLFRAVKVPAGRHEAIFRFYPESYRLGRLISAVGMVLVLFVTIMAVVRSLMWLWH
jgi:hypothetical protein